MSMLKERIHAMRRWQKWLCAAVVGAIVIGSTIAAVTGTSASELSAGPILRPSELSGDSPVFVEPADEPPEVVIQTYFVTGDWKNSRVSGDGAESGEYGPFRSQDRDTFTLWNPEAYPDYAGEPGIIYVFDREYDLRRIVLTLSSKKSYFQLYTSTDGEEYKLIADLDKTNADKAYEKNVCTLDGLDVPDVKYVKIVFTGRSDNGTFISFREAEFFVTGAEPGDTSWMIAEKPDNAKIVSGTAIGSWERDNVNHTSSGMPKSYDYDKDTMWNPLAESFSGNPGVVYTLDRAYDLKRFELSFAGSRHYFELYVSPDGEDYTQLASIAPLNAEKVYLDDGEHYIAKLDGFNLTGVRYVKIIFTGRPSGTRWVGLQEAWFFETGAAPTDNTWMLADGEKGLPITQAEIIGIWNKDSVNSETVPLVSSHDGKLATRWNPEAKAGFSGDPGVVYTLEKASAVKRLELTFSYGVHYYDLYVSSDGGAWTQIASISEKNAGKSYTAAGDYSVSTLDGLQAENVKYIKVIFTGRAGTTSAWVSLHEVKAYDTGTDGLDTAWMLPEAETDLLPITHAEIIGDWKTKNEISATISLANSYDGKASTRWNPEALAGFSGEPGVVYTLEKASAVKRLELTFSYGVHYYDLYVSSDGGAWTQLASITEENADKAYSAMEDYSVSTLDGLQAENVKYIKVIFTGRAGTTSAWVSLHEVKAYDTGTDGLDTAWMLPEAETDLLSITHAEIIGDWKTKNETGATISLANSYDGKASTRWNPEALDGFSGEPGVVYTLKNAAAVKQLELTFSYGVHYFELYVSSNGETWTQLTSVTEENADKVYAAVEDYSVSTLDGLQAENVKYIKVLFTGRAGTTSAWVSLHEVSAKGTPSDEPSDEPSVPNEESVSITGHQLQGTWPKEGGTNRTAEKSYDEDAATSWNASIQKDSSAVIYTLDGTYSLTDIVTTWDRATTYFDLYVSTDGEAWTLAASVTADSGNYDGNTCTLTGLNTEGAKYIKLVFTGNSGTWFSLYEIELAGTAVEDTQSERAVPITSAAISGTWINAGATKKTVEKSFDGSMSTPWNAAVSGKESSVVYTLESAYHLTGAVLVFGDREIYFDLYSSADGQDWTLDESVTADSNHYADGTCTVSTLQTGAVRYVKLIFTGGSKSTAWFNLFEINLVGKAVD